MTDNDIKKAVKLYKKLKCPAQYLSIEYDILPYLQAWNMINSARSQGKTTNILLFGMCLNIICGTQIQYIRRHESELAPKIARDIFKVIEAPAYKYISILTDNNYNGIEYKARRWYFVKRDDNFKIVDIAPEPFCTFLSIDNNELYKSVYNAPKGDFIVFDEYISRKTYLDNEFILLQDLLKTIIRTRLSPIIFMLGNMVDMHCPYFEEFDILPQIKSMQYGEHRLITSPLNTKMHIYLQPTADSREQAESNSKFFGWKSSKLSTITGIGSIWEMDIYPHAPKGNYKILSRGFILYQQRLVCRELRQAEEGFLYVFFYDSDDYIPEIHILYRSDPEFCYTNKIRYGLGYTRTDGVIKQLINNNRACFATNSVGEFLRAYVRTIE